MLIGDEKNLKGYQRHYNIFSWPREKLFEGVGPLLPSIEKLFGGVEPLLPSIEKLFGEVGLLLPSIGRYKLHSAFGRLKNGSKRGFKKSKKRVFNRLTLYCDP